MDTKLREYHITELSRQTTNQIESFMKMANRILTDPSMKELLKKITLDDKRMETLQEWMSLAQEELQKRKSSALNS